MNVKPVVIISLFLFSASFESFSTHFRAGEINVEQVSALTFQITVKVFTDTEGTPVLFGGDDTSILNFGDGTIFNLPSTPNTPRPDLGDGVAMASYTITHTYASYGNYMISFREPNRNEGVINFSNSMETEFYLETLINIDPFLVDDESPVNLFDPIFYGSIGDTFSCSLAAIDSNDNTLYYELITPKQDRDTDVNDYKLPENFKINPYTGLITWDTKFNGFYIEGEYTFCVKILQVKNGGIIGYKTRDFQIILQDFNVDNFLTDSKALNAENRILIEGENQYSFKVFAESTNATSISFNVASELIAEDAISYTTYDSVSETQNIKVLSVTLQSLPTLLRDNPYAIVVRAQYVMPNVILFKDISYLVYTKDLNLPPPPSKGVVTDIQKAEPLFNIYPNPFVNNIFVENNFDKEISVNLYSTDGRLLLQSKKFKDRSIDTESIPSGFYILEIVSSNQSKRIKVVRK